MTMYAEHFGLTEAPFGLTPDTDFYLNARGHQEATNLLSVALNSSEGFIKIVGEVGTGKTMLCRRLLRTLGAGYCTAYIPNPALTPEGLYLALAEELGLEDIDASKHHALVKLISKRLIDLARDGKRVVVVIDEAQTMPEETLEALRLITNLETEKRKLLQIVLFGQPELDKTLARDSMRQFRQRIVFSHYLPPLDRVATGDYIRHRLGRAGFDGQRLFDESAIKSIFKASAGVPRLINILCHKALLSAYGQGVRAVSSKHVTAAVRDTDLGGFGNNYQNHSIAYRALGYGLVGTALLIIGIAFERGIL